MSLSKVDTLVNDVVDTKKFIANIKGTIKEVVSKEISDRVKQWNEEKSDFENRMSAIEKKEEAILRQQRKNNDVLRGFKHVSNNIITEIYSLFESKLGVKNITIANVVAIKLPKDDILYIVKFSNQESKRIMMTNKTKIIGSNLCVSHDRTPKEKDIHRHITKIAEKKKKNGSIVQIGYMKLIVDSGTKIWKEGVGLVEIKNKCKTCQNST